jgi:uncharacterized protein
MPEVISLNKPWLVAVWPGLGQVALSAGYYVLAKLGMHYIAEFSPLELFEMEHVEVKDGLVQLGRLPRSRFFVWKGPPEAHDIVIFLGEAQPPLGRLAFCQKLVEFAKKLDVRRVFTFAAMATSMDLDDPSRVFGAATDDEGLKELKRFDVEILTDGQIGGLNGVLLGVAANNGLRGTCLLGEMPRVVANLPFPKASHAVLSTFTKMAGIKIDLTELSEQAESVNGQLRELFARLQAEMQQRAEGGEESDVPVIPPPEEQLAPEDKERIGTLFEQARNDRSKAYELKRELDRLDVFKEYEDRFLDLFKPNSK